MDDTDDPAGEQGALNEHRDDFTVIPGVGSAINRRLHAAGVDHFRDLAALGADRLTRLLDDIPGLSVEKISNADWIGRAAMLARAMETDGQTDIDALTDIDTDGEEDDEDEAGEASCEDEEDIEPTPGHESFVLRVITHAGSPPRVQLQDVRTGAERQALGLDRLPDLVAGLLSHHLPRVSAALPEVVSPRQAAEHEHGEVPKALLGGFSVALRIAGRVVREKEPFAIDTVFDLRDIANALPPAPHFSVSMFARRMGRGDTQHPLGRRAGELHLATPTVTMAATGLAAGNYRLESVVELTDRSGPGPARRLASHYAEMMLVVLPATG